MHAGREILERPAGAPAPRLRFNTLQDQQRFKQPPSSSRTDPSIGSDLLGFGTCGNLLPVRLPG
jgi:hypothetical protein